MHYPVLIFEVILLCGPRVALFPGSAHVRGESLGTRLPVESHNTGVASSLYWILFPFKRYRVGKYVLKCTLNCGVVGF